MAYYASDGQEVLGQFASGRGYRDLILASEHLPALAGFFERGITKDIPDCIGGVRQSAMVLGDLIRGRQLVLITDGLVPEDGTVKAEVPELTKAGNGVVIAWWLPTALATQIAVPGGEKPDDLHVTILYLGKKETIPDLQLIALTDRLMALTAELAPLAGSIGGVGTFPASETSDGLEVVIGLVDVPRLEALRERVIQVVRSVGIEPVLSHGYTPHIALTYLTPGEDASAQVPVTPIRIEALTLRVGGEPTTLPLLGSTTIKLSKYASRVEPARVALEKHVKAFLAKTGKELAAKIRKIKPAPTDKVTKAKPPKQKAYDYTDNIDWKPLVPDAKKSLAEARGAGSLSALAQVGFSNSDLISEVNDVAEAWAADRGAELVGMKWVDGELVTNPSAKWAISETTRDEIRGIIDEGFAGESSIGGIADQIENAGAFSPGRARMIANTEVARAEHLGNLTGWEASGVVQKVNLLLSDDHDDAADCDCSDLADESPYDIDDVPEVPVHPNCMCSLTPFFGDSD